MTITLDPKILFTYIFQKCKLNRHKIELANILNQLSAELAALNTSTEEDFLNIGDNLQEFSRRAREISETSAGVASLMAGAEINSAIEKLNRILNRMGDLGGECERRTAALQQIIPILNGIERSMSGFMKIVKTLLMLGVFTRVESAHVGIIGEDFSALANQVNELAQDIEAKSNKILSQSHSLASLIEQSLSNVLNIRELQQGQLQKIVTNTTDSLSSLRDKHSSSSTIAINVGQKYQHVYNNIEHIVTLLQIHDITRQQIEHVEKAFVSLATAIQGKSKDNGNNLASPNVGN